MMPGFDSKSNFLKTLLLALVLAVQVLGHAHAVDHSLNGHNSLCSICSIAGHGSAAIVDSGETDVVIPTHQTAPVSSDQSVRWTTRRHHDARAPPLS
jgi:hypothetical protein